MLAIAANTYRQGFCGLQDADFELLCGGEDNELRQLVFSNPSMVHVGLTNFLRREGGFEKLSYEAWQKCLYVALRNPILRKPITENRFEDSGAESYEQGRPFHAAWELLLVLDRTDENAGILSDAFMNIVEFSPPWDDPRFGSPDSELGPDVSIESVWEFSERYEQSALAFVKAMLLKWEEPKRLKDGREANEDKWPSQYGFIRQGIAMGAVKRRAERTLIGFIRDHHDKWARAGYYAGFPFANEEEVNAAHQRDPVLFVEQGVHNDSLYLSTSAGRVFRELVDQRSESEWEDFSDDQMRRSAFHHRGLYLWQKSPLTYPHQMMNWTTCILSYLSESAMNL